MIDFSGKILIFTMILSADLYEKKKTNKLCIKNILIYLDKKTERENKIVWKDKKHSEYSIDHTIIRQHRSNIQRNHQPEKFCKRRFQWTDVDLKHLLFFYCCTQISEFIQALCLMLIDVPARKNKKR